MLQVVPLRNLEKLALKDRHFPVLLAFGANLNSSAGSPAETILESIELLKQTRLQFIATSRLFQTPAFPPSSGFDFVNAALLCTSDLEPREILAILHIVENKFGRERHQRWAARTLDIDLLAVGDQVLPDAETYSMWYKLTPEEQQKTVPDQLILPHPRLQDRAFVLAPLADVAPDWLHPVLNKTVAQLLADLPTSAMDGVRAI